MGDEGILTTIDVDATGEDVFQCEPLRRYMPGLGSTIAFSCNKIK